MADNIQVTPGAGKLVGCDEVTDGVLGTVQIQFTKLMDGTLDSTNKAKIDTFGALRVLACDASGNPIDPTAASPVSQSGSWTTAIVARSTGNGTTSSRVMSAASVNNTNLKASGGQIHQIDLFNTAAYDVFVKFYNKATAPIAGTDTPVWTIPIKAGTGFSKEFVLGKSFPVGIGYAITKLLADSDTTVVAVNDVVGSIDWI